MCRLAVFFYEPTYSWRSQCLRLRSCVIVLPPRCDFIFRMVPLTFFGSWRTWRCLWRPYRYLSRAGDGVCGPSMCCLALHHGFLFSSGKPMMLFSLAVFGMAYCSYYFCSVWSQCLCKIYVGLEYLDDLLHCPENPVCMWYCIPQWSDELIIWT